VNHQDVINFALEQLENGALVELTESMQVYVDEHPDLADELETLTQFWLPTEPLPMPSPALKAGFYQQLNRIETESSVGKPQGTTSWFSGLASMWQQVAVVAMVFVVGIYTGQSSAPSNSDDSLLALQQEVASLSTVMAISMLQDNSASQRLAGASYTKQANMADPLLLETMLSAFSEERSTPVKLAIIDAFENKTNLAMIEEALMEIALTETQPLVQMALSRLLLERASPTIKRQLVSQLREQSLNPDVEEFLNLIDAQNRI
jgi:hypothetical protein